MLQFSFTELLVAVTIAFFLAMYGATLGEKVSGNKVDWAYSLSSRGGLL